jgi:uncharacterized membrane protein YkoI
MDKQKGRWSLERLVALAAIAVGLMAGTYGIASAANGSGSGSSSSTAQTPWGHQRSDETLLSGDTAAKVRQLALAKVPGSTIIRVETDADGHAAYEAHMVKADGTPVTVYVSKQLEVVSVETGMPGPPGQAPAASSSSSGASA